MADIQLWCVCVYGIYSVYIHYIYSIQYTHTHNMYVQYIYTHIYTYTQYMCIYTHTHNIYIYMHIHTHNPFFIHSSVDGHLVFLHILEIVNNTAVNIGVYVPFQISVFIFFGYISGVKLLGHMVVLLFRGFFVFRFCLFIYLGPHPRHVEVPRLGV